jgi:hypothetical protein
MVSSCYLIMYVGYVTYTSEMAWLWHWGHVLKCWVSWVLKVSVWLHDVTDTYIIYGSLNTNLS